MSMTKEEILQILKKTNALLEGHFILTSELHSPQYVEKFRILEQPEYTELLCAEIAEKFRDEKITAVVGPVTGGIILAYEVGKQLGVKSIFTERANDKMQFRRGFTLTPQDTVLIVEDVITTGGSVKEVIEAVRQLGANIAGLACLVDRSNGQAQFEIPFMPLITLDAAAYAPEKCPMCSKGIAAIKPGSR